MIKGIKRSWIYGFKGAVKALEGKRIAKDPDGVFWADGEGSVYAWHGRVYFVHTPDGGTLGGVAPKNEFQYPSQMFPLL